MNRFPLAYVLRMQEVELHKWIIIELQIHASSKSCYIVIYLYRKASRSLRSLLARPKFNAVCTGCPCSGKLSLSMYSIFTCKSGTQLCHKNSLPTWNSRQEGQSRKSFKRYYWLLYETSLSQFALLSTMKQYQKSFF